MSLRRNRRTPASRRPSATASAVAAKVNEGTKTASPGFTSKRHQPQHQRVGAARAADRVLDAAIDRKLVLETFHLRAQDILAMRQYGVDGLPHRAVDPAALRLQVDERDRRPQP